MSKDTLLITLRPSTDVDLGRWLLQYHSIPFTERAHAPIFHILALKYWGVGKDDYPLLVQNGQKYPGDDKILPHIENGLPAEARLMPDKDADPEAYKAIDEIQQYGRTGIGHSVVLWSYYHLLKHKHAVWPSITTGVPWYEKLTCFVAFPLIRSLMYAGLGLNEQVAADALKTIYEGFDHFDAILADGREYLYGDRLTFADLAVSASLGPMVLVQGYQGFLPNQAAVPPAMAKVYQELRDRPTGRYIQRTYDRHRTPQEPPL